MTKARHIIAAIGLVSLFAGGFAGSSPASAQEQDENGQTSSDHNMTGEHGAAEGAGHEGHGASSASDVPNSPSTEAYIAANMAMHGAMDIEFTGDPDIDFALGMIPHHQGAVEMARILLEYGEDPELRQLAQEIIDTQEAEIALLQDWLAEHAE